jgi:hypothetical protein
MAIVMSTVNASVARPSQGIARFFRSSRNVAFVSGKIGIGRFSHSCCILYLHSSRCHHMFEIIIPPLLSFAAGRHTGRNLRNVQIQAVLTADAGLDVSKVRLQKAVF